MPAQRRLIRAGILNRQADTFAHLLHQGGLANLARTRHHLNEAPRLRQALDQYLEFATTSPACMVNPINPI